jgi:hypothetical protein
MKTFIWTAIIGIVVLIGLRLKNQGIFVKPEKAAQSKFDELQVLSPSVFSDVLSKDSNYIAGIFFNKSFNRTIKGDFIVFEPALPIYSGQRVFINTQIPAAFFYVFNEKEKADNFLAGIKSIEGMKNIGRVNSSSRYDSYKLNSYIFEYLDFQIGNKGYTFKIYDADFKPGEEITKAGKDSAVFSDSAKKKITAKEPGPKAKIRSSIFDDPDEEFEEVRLLGDNNLVAGCFVKNEKYFYQDKSGGKKFDLYYAANGLRFNGWIAGHEVSGTLTKINDTLTAKTSRYYMRFILDDNCKKLVCLYEDTESSGKDISAQAVLLDRVNR